MEVFSFDVAVDDDFVAVSSTVNGVTRFVNVCLVFVGVDVNLTDVLDGAVGRGVRDAKIFLVSDSYATVCPVLITPGTDAGPCETET